jgi:peptidyl-prolyl cis-trans isomerase B (cyclophilin B)
MRRGALLPLAVLVLVAAGCGGGDEGGEASPAPAGTAECTEVDAPAPKQAGGNEAPSKALDPAKTYRLVFRTNCGSFTITLDQAAAPRTTASLVALARSGFYDETVFHRIVPGFVIQGGDPTQSGSGGPGYSTVDPPAADARYTKGVVAMAKTGSDPPGTAGSQFFVVTGDDAGLPPDYAIVGEITDGLDVVELIGTLGDEAEQPTQTVLIEKVTVEEA